MPRLRLCGGTKTPPVTSSMVWLPTAIRPASGRSRPAMQRSVVVLPQPEGPSSVTISPAPTSKSTPAMAATCSPVAANVFLSPSTRIMVLILLLHPVTPADDVRDRGQRGQDKEYDHPEGAQEQKRPFVPEIEDDDR